MEASSDEVQSGDGGQAESLLIKITNPTENVPLEKLGAEIVSWENRICDFESRPAADKVSDSVKMAALTAMRPNRLREHLQLNGLPHIMI